jgi:hypothetical protein
VQLLCRKLKEAVARSETYSSYHGELLGILFEVQPRIALEAMCGGEPKELDLGTRIPDKASRYGLHPFDSIPEEILLSWCDKVAEIRYPAVAGSITPVELTGAPGQTRWRSTARKLLDRAPDRRAVLKCFIESLVPSSWRGSRADIIQSNLRPLDELTGYADPPLLELIIEEKAKLREEIQNAAENDGSDSEKGKGKRRTGHQGPSRGNSSRHRGS